MPPPKSCFPTKHSVPQEDSWLAQKQSISFENGHMSPNNRTSNRQISKPSTSPPKFVGQKGKYVPNPKRVNTHCHAFHLRVHNTNTHGQQQCNSELSELMGSFCSKDIWPCVYMHQHTPLLGAAYHSRHPPSNRLPHF
ncbi:hypothetical protein Nepgr_019606 [Nepenthes gracilis]|uniref:Uncharacterized protein n=1 Tax=Nepenthes gracilis TaxID=150966 RepID=A0AAD3STV0_NEPGR|nr:hypothetical protein Nepgr_019606 [Nepenthes gracilis]